MDASRDKARKGAVKKVCCLSSTSRKAAARRESAGHDGNPEKRAPASPVTPQQNMRNAEQAGSGEKRKSASQGGTPTKKSPLQLQPRRGHEQDAQDAQRADSAKDGVPCQPAAATGPKDLPNLLPGIPLDAHVRTPAAQDLERWIRCSPGLLAVVSAGRGMGSSSTVRRAAQLARAAYVRVPGPINRRLRQLQSDCVLTVVQLTAAGPAEVVDVERALQPKADIAVRGLLSDLREKLRAQGKDGPGVSLSLLGKEDTPGEELSLDVPYPVVLHLEELESLGVRQDQAAKQTGRAVSDDWQLYASCALGRALACIAGGVHNLRVALSVRLSSSVHKLFLPPDVPCALVHPPSFALPDQIKPLLLQFLGSFEMVIIEDLSKRLQGPFRLIQKFLYEVRLRKEQTFTPGVIQECVDGSFAKMSCELVSHWALYRPSNKGLLRALCAIWEKASRTGSCRLTPEIKVQLSSIEATGLLNIKVREDKEQVEIATPAPFYKYILDHLKDTHVEQAGEINL